MVHCVGIWTALCRQLLQRKSIRSHGQRYSQGWGQGGSQGYVQGGQAWGQGGGYGQYSSGSSGDKPLHVFLKHRVLLQYEGQGEEVYNR